MKPYSRLLVARMLRAAGLFLMVAAAFGGLLFRASAAPALWPRLHVGFDVGVIEAVTPPPAKNATPSPGPVARRGGHLTLNLSGNLSLGERVARSTRDVSQSSSTQTVGLLAELGRRTGSSSLRLSVPAGLTNTSSAFGELQAEYSTPKYALLYGSSGVSALGGLPLGNTLRGLTLTLPVRSGDISFYAGPAYGAYGQILRVSGIRARALVRGQLVELGYANAYSPDQSAAIRSLVFGIATTTPRLNLLFETALQQSSTNGEPMSAPRPSFSLRGDYGGGNSYASLTVRHIADSFFTLGQGAVQSEDFMSLGVRRQLGDSSISIDEGMGRSGSGFSELSQRRGSFSMSRSLRRATVAFTALDQRVTNINGVTWGGGAGFNVAFQLHHVSALATVQGQRTTSTFSDPVSTMQYGLQLQQPVHTLQFLAGYQASRQTATNIATSTQSLNAAVSKIFGPTALTLGATLTRAQLPLSDQTTFTPLIQISRRVSPAITLSVYTGEQITHDRLNPAYNASTRIFNITLASPFSFGSGHVVGGGNPRLPATISGSVLKDFGNFAATNASVADGLSNVIVVLDNVESQRTDLSGRYSFQFIKPGKHEVRIETSSLPRGLTADRAYSTIELQGGQEGQVFFRVGSYGAVQGHVFGRNANGELAPLDQVAIKIDDSQNAVTTQSGTFGFGRLTAGKHTVRVVIESLPASVSFAGDPTKNVEVRTGEVSSVDFVTDPLGAIEGKVVYDEALGGEHRGPVLNAYVVANPGDHAAITNEDGSFVLDNLPAGTYTLDVDPETLPEETGVVSGAQTVVTLSPSEHHEGVNFAVGHKQKGVVFSLHQDEAPATMSVLQQVLPPLGSTLVRVATPFAAKSVTMSAFGKNVALTPDGSRRLWRGVLTVPPTAPAGTAEISAQVDGPRHTEAAVAIKVDNTISLATATMNPPRPALGQYVRVRARFLANVRAGDVIQWQDGTKTRLGSPISGRVFEFTVKITLYPMRGFLLIEGSKLPIILR